MSGFDKYWNDLQKHQKRLGHWLPHWRGLAERIRDGRGFRYFTLCARSMVDVFMLVKEGLLRVEPANNSIGRVQFCEYDPEQFIEIREMIGREDAGFFGPLEEVALFQDDGFTGQFPTPESIESGLGDEGLDTDAINRLQLKRTFFNLRSSFPYDCINLDFCEYYYEPPDMLRVNSTVERFFEWQRRPSEDNERVEIEEFILTVTCRYDAAFPPPAEERLVQLIRSNCTRSQEYHDELQRTRGTTRPEEWARENREDLFLAGWPKDIALSARQNGWSMDILDYVYYRRVGDRGPFVMACLVSKFTLARGDQAEIRAALLALDRDRRSLIGEIDRASVQGQGLLENLTGIVAAHNQQAARKQRPRLPDP
jgi:hypothetical protein